MTALSAGLCLVEGQWITLLATGARWLMLVLTRYNTHRRSAVPRCAPASVECAG